MIPEIGHYALVLALGLALIQSSLPLWGAARNDFGLMELARTTAIGQFLCLTLAFGALMQAFAISDFSVRLVADNSYSGNPLIYKVAAAWGNHEGSLVLWVWILGLYGMGVAVFGRNLPAPFRARVLAVQGLIGVGFLAFMLFTSNPFLRLDPAPADGQGFNPILQDPALAAHPPMLYTGYVGLSMACAKVVIAGRRTVPLAIAAGPTESGALTGMMGLSPEQAAAIKEQERERIPLKRRGNPNDVARWIVSLADPASGWVTGQVIAVDGGPGLA